MFGFYVQRLGAYVSIKKEIVNYICNVAALIAVIYANNVKLSFLSMCVVLVATWFMITITITINLFI